MKTQNKALDRGNLLTGCQTSRCGIPSKPRFGGLIMAICLIFGSLSPGYSAVVTDTPLGGIYFDDSSATRTLAVVDNFTIELILITISFEKFDGETLGVNGGGTPFYDEIVFNLTSPFGTTVALISENSFNVGSGGFTGTINFSSAAADVVNVNPNVVSAGNFRPVGNLANFNGENSAGDWLLFVQDTVGGDHLGYYSATLTVVPEPATSLLMISGLGACLALRSRKRNRV